MKITISGCLNGNDPVIYVEKGEESATAEEVAKVYKEILKELKKND